MHDLRFIRQFPDDFDRALARRGLSPLAKQILELDEKHRVALTQQQALQSQRNTLAKDFGLLKKQGADTSALSTQSEHLKEQIALNEQQATAYEAALNTLLTGIPNRPAADCPDGKSEADNVVVRTFSAPPTLPFQPQQHFDLGEALGLMDFERAAKLSGARFVVLYKGLAQLERALANFMLDIHTQEFGYEEVYPPFLVKDSAMFGTGQLPKFHDDQFQTTTGHWLIPTAEVVLTNLVSNDILKEEALPLRYTAYTPCFRAEAGAAGRDTRGMIRQHQFSKVELVSITTPDQSAIEHERMTEAAETILKRLELPFRTLALCTGDIGFSAEKTYDLEVWLPGQGLYREISSCSRCSDFQARRMNTRYRPKGDDTKPHFVHTLNGSGVAVGRALVAVLENYQCENGDIAIPHALKPYMRGLEKIEKMR